LGLGSFGTEGRRLQPALRIFGPLVFVFLGLFVLMLGRLAGPRDERHRAGPGLLDRTIERLLTRFAAGRQFWTDLKHSIRTAIRERPVALFLSTVLFAFGWCLSVVEVLIILRLLGSPVALRTGLSIAVLSVLVEGVFFFVPARVGMQEGGLYAIFLVLGLDPARGFSLGVVRRLRELVSGGCGLWILAVSRRDPFLGAKPRADLAGSAP